MLRWVTWDGKICDQAVEPSVAVCFRSHRLDVWNVVFVLIFAKWKVFASSWIAQSLAYSWALDSVMGILNMLDNFVKQALPIVNSQARSWVVDVDGKRICERQKPLGLSPLTLVLPFCNHHWRRKNLLWQCLYYTSDKNWPDFNEAPIDLDPDD